MLPLLLYSARRSTPALVLSVRQRCTNIRPGSANRCAAEIAGLVPQIDDGPHQLRLRRKVAIARPRYGFRKPARPDVAAVVE